MPLDRHQLAALLVARLHRDRAALTSGFRGSAPVRHFVLDGVLPERWLRELAARFPAPGELRLLDTLRERKRIGVDVERYHPEIGALLYAFQDREVVAAVESITGLRGLEPDPTLYASGISVMGEGDFLNPHLDNSHDGDQRLYRVLNLLFYVGPEYDPAQGGNLELWAADRRQPYTVPSLFNRLVVMETGPRSWHSVSPLRGLRPRLCVSNYYFAAASVGGAAYRHVTTYAGRPEEPVKKVLLGADAVLRNALGRAFPGLLRRTRHRRAAPPREQGAP